MLNKHVQKLQSSCKEQMEKFTLEQQHLNPTMYAMKACASRRVGEEEKSWKKNNHLYLIVEGSPKQLCLRCAIVVNISGKMTTAYANQRFHSDFIPSIMKKNFHNNLKSSSETRKKEANKRRQVRNLFSHQLYGEISPSNIAAPIAEN
ncbi:hypothetical protein T01_13253 [Trichinella spiralis]|uniref:Uncharacterized protein n=1 Tax=Trichinella spiralis TaxID=6334 RepID=A0A0V1C0C1_TRISP|nr:hypothetical protein T01_13253 [Trichinella spiralis]